MSDLQAGKRYNCNSKAEARQLIKEWYKIEDKIFKNNNDEKN
jgi:hypothetical protein